MSVLPFPRRPVARPTTEPYCQPDHRSEPSVRLLGLSALEQMYAYWDSDRE